MVDDVVLRQLDGAVQDAANRRNEVQSKVNDLRRQFSDANINLQRAQNQEQIATDAEKLKSEEHRKLFDYYNGLVDKSGLESVLERIEKLAAEQREAVHLVASAREIRVQCNRQLEAAQREMAVAEQNLKKVQEQWQRVSDEAIKARNER
jgi:ribosome recycling factor